LAPLLAVVVLRSVLYDGWRQLYFIYPTFLLVTMRGLVALFRWKPQGQWSAYWPKLMRSLLVVSIVTTAAQIVWLHPQQQVYFNFLPGRHIEQKFEMDYWSLSYRWGLEWITKHDDRPVIYVNAPMEGSVELNRWMLDEYAAERIKFVAEPEKADYFITTYRWHPEPYPYQNEVARLEAGKRRVLSIFRIK